MKVISMMFPTGRFAVIYADPPWNFRTRSAKGRDRCTDGQGHYQVMSIEDIKALPVLGLAAADSALLMWVVSCYLKDGLLVGRDCPVRSLRN